MRLRACLALLCLMLAGCQHLPDGVVIDLEDRSVSVGPCRCTLPDETPALEPEPEPEPEPQPAPDAEPEQGNQSPDAPE